MESLSDTDFILRGVSRLQHPCADDALCCPVVFPCVQSSFKIRLPILAAVTEMC